MSFSRCLDIWGLIGEMRRDHRPDLQTQSTRYASGVLIKFSCRNGKKTGHSQVAIELHAVTLEGVLQSRLQS